MSQLDQIQACLALVDVGIPEEYSEGGRESQTIISSADERIVYHQGMELWARSVGQAEITVNMMSPSLRNWLRVLASNGPGHASQYNGVEYRFTPSTFLHTVSYYEKNSNEGTLCSDFGHLE